MKRIEKNWLEWTVFAMGLLLVLSTLGFLVVDSIARKPTPPTLEVTTGAAHATDGGFSVPVTVRNKGGQTAENVVIEVLLEIEGRQAERAELRLSFVPRRSTRDGWVVLRGDPRGGGRVSARPVAYEAP